MKTLTKLVFLAVILFTASYSYSQKDNYFEGLVKYDITIEGDSLDEMTRSMMPTEAKTYYQTDKIRTEMVMSMMTIVVLQDLKGAVSTTLLNLFGQKMAIKMTEEEIKKELEKQAKFTINYTNETSVIAGYNCKKAEAIYEDGKKDEFYYTEEIKVPKNSNFNSQYGQIGGVLMDYKKTEKGITMHLKVSEVEKQKLPSSLFIIPKEYKVMSSGDMKNMFK